MCCWLFDKLYLSFFGITPYYRIHPDHHAFWINPKNGNHIIVDTKDVIAIEAQEAYSCIHSTSGNYLMSKNLKHFETILEQNITFFRSHKSWIVNLPHLINFSKSKLEIELTNQITAKLSKYKKTEFEEIILH